MHLREDSSGASCAVQLGVLEFGMDRSCRRELASRSRSQAAAEATEGNRVESAAGCCERQPRCTAESCNKSRKPSVAESCGMTVLIGGCVPLCADRWPRAEELLSADIATWVLL